MQSDLGYSEFEQFNWPDTQKHSRLLRGVSRIAIFQVAGALQLKANTSGELIVFHRLAALGRLLTEEVTGKLSTGRLKKIVKLSEISGDWITLQADPPEGPLTVEIPGPNGPTTILQGLNNFSGSETLLMLSAIQSEPTRLSKELRKSIRVLSEFVLLISQMLSTRAGIAPNSFLTENEYSTPQFSNSEMSKLSQFVTFEANEVFENFTAEEVSLISRLLFLHQEIDSPLSTDSVFDRTTLLYPFYEWGNQLIVHSPLDLLPALQNAAVRLAKELDEIDEFFSVLTETNRTTLRSLLENYSQPRPFNFTESGSSLLIHTSAFSSTDTIFRIESPAESVQAQIPGSGTHTEPRYFLPPFHSENARVLLLSNFDAQDSARFYGLEDGQPAIVVHLEELKIILYYLDFDLTRLSYFINSVYELDGSARFSSAFDLFVIYRENDFSFYLSDDGQPTSIFIEPSSASTLWRQYYDEVNPRWFEVPGTSFSTKSIKADAHRSNRFVALLTGRSINFIEIPGTTIAVMNQAPINEPDDSPQLSLSQLANPLFDSFTFWLSEFLSWLSEHELSPDLNIRLIYVSFAESRANTFSNELSHAGEAKVQIVYYFPELSDVDPTVLEDLDTYIIESTARIIQFLFGWSDSERDRHHQKFYSECYFKRMRKFTSSSLEFELNPGAPAARLLSREQDSRGLDSLGEFLRGPGGFKVGDIPKGMRTSTINKLIVPFFGDLLSSKVEAYSAQSLLTTLLIRHEALLQFSAKFRGDFDARKEDPKIVGNAGDIYLQELSRISETLLSSRFIIEFASFVGSEGGSKVITDEEYDHLLSLSSEVINRGVLSDSISKELADVTLSILPSGRLGISRDDEYHVAVKDFIQAKLQRGASSHQLDWFLDNSAIRAEALQVFKVENDFTIDDLSNVIYGLIDQLDDKSLDVSAQKLEEIIQYLSDNRDISPELTTKVLDFLTLSSGRGNKEKFWELGKEVRPWRFNRKHTILNQPIIPIPINNSTLLLHGKRTLQQAYQYQLQKLVEARVEGSSQESKSLNSRINHVKGKSFEVQTSKTVRESLRGKVRSAVSNFGTVNLKKYRGKNLGDIDIVYVDEISKSIWIGELKSLLGGRTPSEFASERDKIYGKKSSAETRLRNRVEVVLEHLDQFLPSFGLALNNEKWNVFGVIVVESEILSMHLNHGKFPVLKVEELIREISEYERKHSNS